MNQVLKTNKAKIVGESVAVLIGRILSTNKSKRPAILVKNFSLEELAEIPPHLVEVHLPGRASPVQVIVAAPNQEAGHFDNLESPQRCLNGDESLIAARNRLSVDGTVFLVLGVNPAELKSMKDFLMVGDDTLLNAHEVLLECAWKVNCRGPLPGVLISNIYAVYKAYLETDQLALRRWVDFLDQLTRNLYEEGGPWTENIVQNEISTTLTKLRLFPDASLFSNNPAKRLRLNFRIANKQNPLSGAYLDDDDWEEKITTTQFVGENDEPLSDVGRNELQGAMRKFINHPTRLQAKHYERIQLNSWLQLFAKERVPTERLGDQVHRYISDMAPKRVLELEGLHLIEGLNESSSESAEKLITTEIPPGQATSLFGTLNRTLRKKIEKLIVIRGQASDPLTAILRHIHQHRIEGEKLEISPVSNSENTVFTRRLFALLYGRTLQQVALRSEDSSGIQLAIHNDLLEIGELSEKFDDDDDDGKSNKWEDLALQIKLDGNTVSKFVWSPVRENLISFGRLIMENDKGGVLEIQNLESLEERSRDPKISLPTSKELGNHELLDEWLKCRTDHFSHFRKEGIDSEGLRSLVENYERVLITAKNTLHVPKHSSVLHDFLEVDTAVMTDRGGSVILGTHPIRLRWLGEKFEHIQNDLVKTLCGELQLNSCNEDFYFKWLEDLSPFQQPPVMALAGSYNFAMREVGFHQEFRSLKSASHNDNQWTSGVDDGCLKIIAAQVDKYMQSFPHKVDGLSLLIVPPIGDYDFPKNLIKKIKEKLDSSTVLKIHITADLKDHQRISSSLSQLEEDEKENLERHKIKSLMPLFQVTVHNILDFTIKNGEFENALEGQIDIAVVPDLFSVNVSCHDNVRDISGASGQFNALLDAPIHQQDPIRQSSVLELIPVQPDILLANWSTLTVRRKRNAAVGEVKDIDFVTVSVEYEEKERHFIKLHNYAHWVITLDQFVGRSQIDAMDATLDVIHVEEEVGTNRAYSLVVSSNSGKAFVQHRFATKLTESLRIIEDPEEAQEIAGHLYEVGRDVSPAILLQALGLGQTAAEIIGLTAFRFAVTKWFPTQSNNKIEIYLNLDELTSWFGGHHRRRADVLRLTIFPSSSGGGEIEILVCESKYRDSEKPKTIEEAAEQVTDTIELLEEAFQCVDGEEPAGDQKFWWRSLANAISQLPKKASDMHGRLPVYKEHPTLSNTNRRLLIEELAHGKFEVRIIKGAIFSTAYSADGEDEMSEYKGMNIVRTRRAGLQRIFSSLKDPTSEIWAEPSTPTQEPDLIERTKEFVEESSKPARKTAKQGMSNDDLVNAYQKVLDVFSSHNVSVARPDENTVPLYEQGPGFYIIRIKPAAGTPSSSLTKKIDELKLGLELEREQNIRYYTDRGSIVFEIPKQDHQRYFVDAEGDLWDKCTWPDGELYAPIGEDISGDIVGINFSSSTSPHLLIAGVTGSGKSVALETILCGLCRKYSTDELRLDLVDPKQTELISFAEDPHVNGEIGFGVEDSVQILEELLLEMENRSSDFRKIKVNSLIKYNEKVPPEDRKPWRVLVLDEYADLTADSSDQQQIEAPLKRLAGTGRAAGIHIILATQRPSVDVINAVIRSNFPAQLALRVRTSTDSRIIIGESGAESLSGNGDALFRTADGIKRIQCAKYTP